MRYFDTEGEFLHRVGRQGRGPGEFEGGPIIVSSFETDSLLLFAARPVRFHFLSVGDGGYRHIRPTTWRGATPPIGFVNPYVLVGLWHLHKPTTTGPYEIPATYAWVDVTTGSRILVDSFTIRPQYMTKMVNGVAWGGPVPFGAIPSAVVNKNAALITRGALPEITEYDISGRLQRIIRIDQPARDVTDADVQRYVEATGKPLDPDIPLPESMPAFESLKADAEGWLWAKVFEPDPVRRPSWVVFDPRGRAHGSIETPSKLEIHHIGADFLLGVWKDELDVEHVRRYRLTRR